MRYFNVVIWVWLLVELNLGGNYIYHLSLIGWGAQYMKFACFVYCISNLVMVNMNLRLWLELQVCKNSFP
jgi:hypothetical protein